MKDVEEERVMHSRSDNIKFTSYNDANGIAGEIFESLRSRNQRNLETSIIGSDFIFDSNQLMYYERRKVNFRRGGSYIRSPNSIKKQQ